MYFKDLKIKKFQILFLFLFLILLGCSRDEDFDNSDFVSEIETVLPNEAPFIITGNNGLVYISNDGTNWQNRSYDYNISFQKVAYGKGKYVIANDENNIYFSNDASSWTRTYSGEGMNIINKLIYNNLYFIGVGGNGLIVKSNDGELWNILSSEESSSFNGLAYGNGILMAGSAKGIYTSLDGTNFTFKARAGSDKEIYFFENYFYILDGNSISKSMNGQSWTSHSTNSSGNFISLAYGNNIYVGLEVSTSIWRSENITNGFNQINNATELSSPKKVIYRKNIFVAIGSSSGSGSNRSMIYTSSDGMSWTKRLELIDRSFNDIY